MKFSTVEADGKPLYGAIVEDNFVALSPEFPQWKTLRDVIAADGLAALADTAAGRDVTHEKGRFTYAIPVPDPEKIICVGVNYANRNEEYRDGQELPAYPSLFPRFARSFVGHGMPLTRPKASRQLDYEGEIVIVIGGGGRHIEEADALNHVAALSICNEGTIRDWVRHGKFNVTQGKNFDGSAAMGPWIVPVTDSDQLSDMRLTTRVNGEVRQDDTTDNMIFPFARQIAYISTFTTLVPGDIIVTGTPTGAGARFDPPVWLEPGDEIEVEVSGVGALRNGVVDEG